MCLIHPPVRLDAQAPFQVVKTITPFEPFAPHDDAVSSPSVNIKPEPTFEGIEDDDLRAEPEDEKEKDKRNDDDRGFFS